MALHHQLTGKRDEVSIVQQPSLRRKDRGILRPQTAGGVIDQRLHLRPGAHQRIVQQRAARDQIDRLVGHVQFRRGQDMDGTDGEARAGGYPGDHRGIAGRFPAAHRRLRLFGGTGGIGLLTNREAGDGAHELVQRVPVARRNGSAFACLQPQLQQRDDTARIGHVSVMSDAYGRSQALGCFRPG